MVLERNEHVRTFSRLRPRQIEHVRRRIELIQALSRQCRIKKKCEQVSQMNRIALNQTFFVDLEKQQNFI